MSKKAGARTPKAGTRKPVRSNPRPLETDAEPLEFSLGEPRARSGGQSGDLQGLPSMESADSESVDELVEEGNAFEADAILGVEDAGEPREVHTREVLEDDVPEEYLDQDEK